MGRRKCHDRIDTGRLGVRERQGKACHDAAHTMAHDSDTHIALSGIHGTKIPYHLIHVVRLVLKRLAVKSRKVLVKINREPGRGSRHILHIIIWYFEPSIPVLIERT